MLLEQTLLFSPLILGCYLSYHILKITDLSVDGTYVLGAAVFARMIDFGLITALALSILAGLIVGSIVAYMQRNNAISDLLVGILTSFMLYSINMQVMGRPNLSVLGKASILSVLQLECWIIPLTVLVVILIALMIFLFRNQTGLMLRAFGYNQKLLKTLGKSTENYRLMGLACSGGLASLCGAMTAQLNGFADINMGFGVALISIGALVIGRHIVIRNKQDFIIFRELLSCFVGILIYFAILDTFLKIGIDPVNIKLALGITLFFALNRVGRNKIS